ncbi:low molecular weight protein arginine phosphatase [Calycomorphotria hydatis]|uniref:protein-tyrosine-phosphatase n=1 Tax=Calycomorphotria hydatis TaxID=2528027 RepID=A0A517TAN8_9PLAN|nr:low molecular weight protein arginine phosphatase [Calycomorphotria hydatis]QDT65441.1 Low molecular weight protein-tyrosine-phosphatase YwlE [Calycomorphotria hydatis]
MNSRLNHKVVETLAPPRQINLHTVDDPLDALQQGVEELAAGGALCLPTECGYVLVTKLFEASPVWSTEGCRSLLAVAHPEEARDYIPGMNAQGTRIARRIWPGPNVLRLPIDTEAGLFPTLDDASNRLMDEAKRGSVICPAYPVLKELRSYLPQPLLLGLPSRPIATPGEWLERYPETATLVFSDEKLDNLKEPTWIDQQDDDWEITSEGTLTSTDLNKLLGEVYLFVCTGNTCRSPLAEAMFRKLLADRVGCEQHELTEHGFVVGSAGLAAAYGMPASSESLTVSREHGYILEDHFSQPLTDQLLDRADYVFTMTSRHREAIISARPDLADRVRLLSREGLDVADPIGGGPAEYEHCRIEIERELLVIVENISIRGKK